MLTRRACLLTGAVAAAAPWMAHAESPPVLSPWGVRPTPALNAVDLAGRPWDLKAFAGHALLLNFWASYCAPCQIEMPGLNRLQARFGPQGLRVAGLNHGEMPERVRLFLARVPFAGQVLLDRSQTQLAAWGSQALPTSVLIDAQGLARWWHVGELDWDAPAVQAQVRAVVQTS